jgi:hypothetical protein
MTQDEMQRLLLEVVDQISRIEKSQQYLHIAIEQLDNSSDKTNLRVELLVSTYLSDTDDALDILRVDFRKLRKVLSSQLCNSDK